MTDEKKPLKIEFAPGAFDNFDGTQEELDDLLKHIQEKFSAMTPEELALESTPMTEEEFDSLPMEVQAQLMRSHFNDDDDDDLADEFKRNLQ